MKTTSKITILPIKRTFRAFIALPGLKLADARKLTLEETEAIAAQLSEIDWELVAVEPVGGFEIDLAELADDMPQYLPPSPAIKPTIAARAAEIGVSMQTLYRWQRQDCIDVFNNEEVRSLLARRKNHIWHITDKFKARM